MWTPAPALGVTPKESYKVQGHRWKLLKGVGKNYCESCGLIALNNPITNWCIDKGCYYDLHPSYKNALHNLIPKPIGF